MAFGGGEQDERVIQIDKKENKRLKKEQKQSLQKFHECLKE